jgi:hypothetical protein
MELMEFERKSTFLGVSLANCDRSKLIEIIKHLSDNLNNERKSHLASIDILKPSNN